MRPIVGRYTDSSDRRGRGVAVNQCINVTEVEFFGSSEKTSRDSGRLRNVIAGNNLVKPGR